MAGLAMIRTIEAGMDEAVVARVEARLADIRRDHRCRYRSSSKAAAAPGAFPRPTATMIAASCLSRPLDDYLSPWPRRDVIETPLDGDLDVNGWDLGKALKLLLKGNAVVIEWLRRRSSTRRSRLSRRLLALADGHVAARRLIARHYLHLGRASAQLYFGDGEPVELKKIFYALRPAAALRWLRLHPGEAVAPMHFPTLMAAASRPPLSSRWSTT